MLYFDFDGYQGFKERFGMQDHGNGSKSRKNKILLAFVKSEFKKKNYEVINFKDMAEMKVYVWSKLLEATLHEKDLLYPVQLMNYTFFSSIYKTDEWFGVCEDHDTRSVRYCNMEQSGRVYKMKAGKMLHHLINCTEYGRNLAEPVQRWIEEEFSLEWQTYCMGKLPENKLIINDDFKRIYSSEDCVGCFSSCMVDQDHWHYYKNSVNAKAAFLVNDDDMVIARAILWPEVYDDEGKVWRYLDRQYATDGNQVLMRALIDELIKAGEIDCYKVPGCGCSEATAIVDVEGHSLSNKCFHIKCTLGTSGCLSYQDTFKFYNYNEGIVYNSSSRGWDYGLDTTAYSIDEDDEDDDENFDEYHDEYTTSDTCTVYVHGEEMSCSEDWLDEFHWIDRLTEYHHRDDCFYCPECKCWELKEHEYESEITGETYCCEECRTVAEKRYKETNWKWSDFDQDYYEDESEITFFNCWNPETQTYTEKTISWNSLSEMVDRGLMFLFAGEYCNALDPQTNQPYKKAA